mmetsp:Transcript_26813/g.56012  ORF Transcript_26813/g.56012 Transcript_26813/m.56012 type:complete len:242 (-) Transcript_26813:99-824(-)
MLQGNDLVRQILSLLSIVHNVSALHVGVAHLNAARARLILARQFTSGRVRVVAEWAGEIHDVGGGREVSREELHGRAIRRCIDGHGRLGRLGNRGLRRRRRRASTGDGWRRDALARRPRRCGGGGRGFSDTRHAQIVHYRALLALKVTDTLLQARLLQLQLAYVRIQVFARWSGCPSIKTVHAEQANEQKRGEHTSQPHRVRHCTGRAVIVRSHDDTPWPSYVLLKRRGGDRCFANLSRKV